VNNYNKLIVLSYVILGMSLVYYLEKLIKNSFFPITRDYVSFKN